MLQVWVQLDKMPPDTDSDSKLHANDKLYTKLMAQVYMQKLHHLRKMLYSPTHITMCFISHISKNGSVFTRSVWTAVQQFSCKLNTGYFCQQCRPSFRTKAKKVQTPSIFTSHVLHFQPKVGNRVILVIDGLIGPLLSVLIQKVL